MFTRLLASTLVSLVFGFGLAGCSSGGGTSDSSPNPQNTTETTPVQPTGKTVLQVVREDPELSTLAEAIDLAGLGDTLADEAAVTLFAPTNEAFEALWSEPGWSKEALFGNRALLRQVLSYHVLRRKASVEECGCLLGVLATLEGGIFKVDPFAPRADWRATDERNRVSRIVRPDLEASNGYVHVMSGVMLPGNQDLMQQLLARAPEFSTLLEAIEVADLAETLRGPGPYTVFAPSDAAFEALFQTIPKADLFADVATLRQVLLHHVFGGRFIKGDAPLDAPVRMADGQDVQIAEGFSAVVSASGNRVDIVGFDLLARNGIIHTVADVMLPAGLVF